MDCPIIHKKKTAGKSPPNMADYDQARPEFSWAGARLPLEDRAGVDKLNIFDVVIERHLRAGRGEHTALRWLPKSGEPIDFSYADLANLGNRFANALHDLGVAKGERIFTLLGRVPALYVTALGGWKHEAVLCPLFAAFGPEPIVARMLIAQPSVLVTSTRLFERKIANVIDQLPFLRHVILVDDSPEAVTTLSALAKTPSRTEAKTPDTISPGCHQHDFHNLVASALPEHRITQTDPETLAILHFTSGTTGRPKAAMHVHEAVVAHLATASLALDLHPDDVYWCTADPGWVTGVSYGIIGPLAIGCTMIADEEEFNAERWYQTLARHRVNVWYTAPTAIRMLMKAGEALPQDFDLSALRYIASVGEPLNPEAVLWSERVLALPIHDNWWQTETGGIMVSNYACMDIKPGSMGKPLPGIDAAVVHSDDAGLHFIDTPDQQGELALKSGWPSMFRGYLNEQLRYQHCFIDGWYLSGDMVKRDADGFYWFVGRGDDVIKSSGHLIGPFEIESVLMEHPAVAEAAAIGIPDPIALEAVKAFVSLKQGFLASDRLNSELLAHARKRLGPAIAPREIVFRDSLPKTRSGKIMRRLLKARELGLPEGDLSTLESGT
jgi:acetyl-CoA synthetase